jgi:transcriptional regulator with XRE-family HTH domain
MKDKTNNEGSMSIFNVHLGRKLRDRRLSLGLTQTKVGDALGFSFQQIQKYEKGLNGVTSEKLLDLANVLQVPINFFYEGYDKNVREFENDRQNK